MRKFKKLIKKIICAYSGHNLPDDAEFRCYIREGRRFKYNGKMFRCKRCGTLVHIRGVRNKELTDLIKATLESMPNIGIDLSLPDYYRGYRGK